MRQIRLFLEKSDNFKYTDFKYLKVDICGDVYLDVEFVDGCWRSLWVGLKLKMAFSNGNICFEVGSTGGSYLELAGLCWFVVLGYFHMKVDSICYQSNII